MNLLNFAILLNFVLIYNRGQRERGKYPYARPMIKGVFTFREIKEV